MRFWSELELTDRCQNVQWSGTDGKSVWVAFALVSGRAMSSVRVGVGRSSREESEIINR